MDSGRRGTEGFGLSDFFDMRNTSGWLPSAGPPPRRRRVWAFVRRSLLVVLCFAVGVTLAVGALVWQGRNDLVGTRIALDTLGQPPVSEGPTEPQGLSEARNVLLVGSDSADDLSQEYRDLGTGERDGLRTDTIMVLRIDPQGGRITGINFPRDLLVTLCDGSRQRINAAVFTGGPDCLVETVREFSGVQIDHFVQVNFEGFVRIVDAVGGVPLYLEEPMVDDKAHLDLPKGCVELDGRNALGFVRTRLDNDFGRIARQQRFLKELADRATSLPVLTNPVSLFRLVDSVGELLTVDDGLSLGTMRRFATTLRNVESDDISLATIPTVTDSSTGAYYEIPIEQETRQLLRAFKTQRLPEYLGEAPRRRPTPSPSAEPTPEPKVPLDELAPVTVLNGSAVSGLATATADALAAAGVEVASIGNAEQPWPIDVVLAYPPGLLSEAQSLQVGAFPDAQLRLDETASTVTVTVDGDVDPELIAPSDDDGASSSSSQPDPRPSAPPTPEYVNADPDLGNDRC